MRTCYYEVLGVERKAKAGEIKKAYRPLKWHPDERRQRRGGDGQVKEAHNAAPSSATRAREADRTASPSLREGAAAGAADGMTTAAAGAPLGPKELLKSFDRPSYDGFDDAERGFYAVYRRLFARLTRRRRRGGRGTTRPRRASGPRARRTRRSGLHREGNCFAEAVHNVDKFNLATRRPPQPPRDGGGEQEAAAQGPQGFHGHRPQPRVLHQEARPARQGGEAAAKQNRRRKSSRSCGRRRPRPRSCGRMRRCVRSARPEGGGGATGVGDARRRGDDEERERRGGGAGPGACACLSSPVPAPCRLVRSDAHTLAWRAAVRVHGGHPARRPEQTYFGTAPSAKAAKTAAAAEAVAALAQEPASGQEPAALRGANAVATSTSSAEVTAHFLLVFPSPTLLCESGACVDHGCLRFAQNLLSGKPVYRRARP